METHLMDSTVKRNFCISEIVYIKNEAYVCKGNGFDCVNNLEKTLRHDLESDVECEPFR